MTGSRVSSQPGTRAVVGVDVGTTAVKAVVSSTDGRTLGSSTSNVRMGQPSPQYAEQDMEEIWMAVSAAIAAAVDEAGSQGEVSYVALAVTGQGDGAWLVDGAGKPVRQACLWLDGRAADRVSRWEEDGRADLVREVTGSALFPGALPVLLEQLEEDDPEAFSRAAVHLNCKDWVRYRLTGQIATDPSEASRTYLDVATGEYSDRLIEGLGHERFRHLLPPVASSTSLAGEVLESVALETGLPEGLAVATCMVDTSVGGLGLGAIESDDCYAILGTTAFVGLVREKMTADQTLPLVTIRAGSHVVECLAPMNGTPSLDWVRDVTGLSSLDWDEIDELVKQSTPGAHGVLFLPYVSISGERAPIVDTNASATWFNLSVRTERCDLVRAVYEGVALSMRECMDLLDVPARASARLCGGGSRSPVLCQILADVTGRSIIRSTVDELGALGAQALALVATSESPTLRDALEALTDDRPDVFEPFQGRDIHRSQASLFAELRDAVRPIWPAARRLREQAATS